MTSFVSGKRYPDNAKGGIPAGSENEGGLLYAESTGTEAADTARRSTVHRAGAAVRLSAARICRRAGADGQRAQGILAVIRREDARLESLFEKRDGTEPFLIVLDHLQDPGNLGTILRTAEGAGATGVILTKDCADLYQPKTIRSTMGAIYRMPAVIVEDLKATLGKMKECGIHTYAAHLDDSRFYDEEDYTKATAFLIGNEGNGLPQEICAEAEHRIKIPMHGQVESLNAAMAAGILMYEVCRQRRR